jgi:hypothetical protein
MAQMYEAGSGIDVDGVFVMDPTAVASLLRVAGPVRIDAIDRSIDAESLEQFLLVDQFDLDEATRRDVAEAVSALALEQFLTATLPEPQRVGELLGPAATEGHIVGWAERTDEQDVFRLIGMAGELPRPDGRDGLAVVTDNVGDNSIDGFLERSTAYDAVYDEATGEVDGDVVITLRNTAPSTGLPDDVIGNDLGLPAGTNRTRLTLYSPLSIGEITVDGAEPTVAAALADARIDGNERGWNTASWVLDIPAGDTITVRIRVTGSVSADRYEFVRRPQPVVRGDPLTLEVRTAAGGDPVARFDGELPRTSVVVGDDATPMR